MRIASCLILLLPLIGCHASTPALAVNRDLPAGTILQYSDLEIRDTEYPRVLSPLSRPKWFTEDRSRVVGHKLLRPLHEHQPIWLMGDHGELSQSDID